ncbi:MAG: hypothetical protein Q9195_004442 [Heterodermia aff. obscurata]
MDTPPHRWLADVKKRIGKCIIFGLRPKQVDEAGKILRVLARDWKELLAGSEGFLVGRSRAGLERHRVAWGEMDSMHVSVYHKLRESPTNSTDSFLLDVLILSERHQRPAARCVEDIVLYDYRKGAKTPLKEFMSRKFNQTWKAQEQAGKLNKLRIYNLLERVEGLEKESWDKEGAVEDLGAGG